MMQGSRPGQETKEGVPRTLNAIFRNHRDTDTALAEPAGMALTYAGLNREVSRLGKYLNRMGIGRHSVVAVAIPGGVSQSVALLGVSSTATCAPLNPQYRGDEFARYLHHMGADALIVEAEHATAARGAAKALDIPILTVGTTPSGSSSGYTVEGETGLDPIEFTAVAPDDIALLLHTSGTTSRPKLVPLSHHNLVSSAGAIAQYLQLGPADRCLNIMPLQHIHGLAGMLFPSLFVGAEVVCISNLDLQRLMLWFRKLRPSWYSAVPTIHQAMVETLHGQHSTGLFDSLRFVRSSSAPLPPGLCERMEALFGVPVIEAYGMTEAAHQITSNPLPPGQRKPGSVGVPVKTQVCVIGKAGKSLPAGEVGEIAIKGAGVTGGYLKAGYSNAKLFRDGWFRTGDLGSLDDDGYLFLVGRLKEQINRGGEKISPQEVDDVLLSHQQIERAATFPVTHSRLGEEVASAVVLCENSRITAQDIRFHVRARLANFKVPRHVLIVDHIPRNATGKYQRKALSKHFRSMLAEQVSKSETDRDHTAMEQRILEIWAQVLNTGSLRLDDDFFDLGGDSILAMQVVNRIAESTGLWVTIDKFFEHPTVTGLSRVIACSPEVERARIRHLPLSPGESQPLSFAQERLWFLGRLHKNHSAHHRPVALKLQGALDKASLERALNGIVERHSVIRTRYTDIGGVPLAVVDAPTSLVLEVAPIADVSAGSVEAATRRMLTQDFDLQHECPVRIVLLKASDICHVLLMDFHHICFDGWSQGVLLNELAEIYEAYRINKSPRLPELVIQYTDYAQWQRRYWETSIGSERHLDYWVKRTQTPAANLDALYDTQPMTVGAGEAGHHVHHLPQSLVARLADIFRERKATLFMGLITTWALLMHRRTGAADMVLGMPVSGRERPEFEPLIGNFLNTLPLRICVSGNPNFESLLGQVRQVVVEAFAHQMVPFEQIVKRVLPERDLARNPLFQCVFQYENFGTRLVNMTTLDAEIIEIESVFTTIDLSVELSNRAGGLDCVIIYRRDRFEDSSIAELIDQYHLLLQQICETPRGNLGSYSLVSEGARALIPDLTTPLETPVQVCVVTQFLDISHRTPHAPAVIARNTTLSYAALASRASAIASLLHGKSGCTVAIHGSRCVGLVASILGVLISGNRILLIDKALPPARIEYMCTAANVELEIVLGTGEIETGNGGRSCLAVDSSTGLPRLNPRGRKLSNIVARGGSFGPAYIFFTSGSTGEPKGILGTHEGLAHFIDWERHALGVTPEDRIAQFTKLSFDAILRDIFLPLTSGAALCLPNAEDESSGRRWVGWLLEHGITILHIVPAVAASWLSDIDAGNCAPALRWAVFSGEPLTQSLVERWRKRLNAACGIINLYGPTETTLAKSCFRVPIPALPGIQPLGAPLPQTQMLVLNKYGVPCGLGEPGEIVIRTPFRTLGYINRPHAQARAFTANPWRKDGDMLYRSGDRGRLKCVGGIEFLGRLDRQLKIRGVRLEPQEIELAMNAFPGIAQAAVTIRKHGDDKQLVALYTLDSSEPVDLQALRRYLRQRLPLVFVPSLYVQVARFHITPTGKIDRAALDGMAEEQQTLRRTPSNRSKNVAERVLAAMWKSLLGISKVHIDDDFFALGGHSMLAVQLLEHISAVFAKNLTLLTLFEAPTIRQLAARLQDAQGVRPDLPLIGLNKEGSAVPLFGLAGAKGAALRLLLVARELPADQPFYGLQPPNMDWSSVGCESIYQMARYYIGLIRSIHPLGPYRILGSSFGGIMAFEIVKQLEKEGAKVLFLGIVDTRVPGHGGKPRRHEPEITRSAETREFAVTAGNRVARQHNRAQATHTFRGAVDSPIIFFLCAGNPVERDDRRQLWRKHTRSGLAVLKLPGVHGAFDREPQFTSFVNNLRLCLGEGDLQLNRPDDDFNMDYTLRPRGRKVVSIRAPSGRHYSVLPGYCEGSIELLSMNKKIAVSGWAVDAANKALPDKLLVFYNDVVLGIGSCGYVRNDIEPYGSDAMLRYCGYRLRMSTPPGAELTKIRVFAIGARGIATELTVNKQVSGL